MSYASLKEDWEWKVKIFPSFPYLDEVSTIDYHPVYIYAALECTTLPSGTILNCQSCTTDWNLNTTYPLTHPLPTPSLSSWGRYKREHSVSQFLSLSLSLSLSLLLRSLNLHTHMHKHAHATYNYTSYTPLIFINSHTHTRTRTPTPTHTILYNSESAEDTACHVGLHWSLQQGAQRWPPGPSPSPVWCHLPRCGCISESWRGGATVKCCQADERLHKQCCGALHLLPQGCLWYVSCHHKSLFQNYCL